MSRLLQGPRNPHFPGDAHWCQKLKYERQFYWPTIDTMPEAGATWVLSKTIHFEHH